MFSYFVSLTDTENSTLFLFGGYTCTLFKNFAKE